MQMMPIPDRCSKCSRVRSKDAKNWADRYLAERLESGLRTTACIPTTQGGFGVPELYAPASGRGASATRAELDLRTSEGRTQRALVPHLAGAAGTPRASREAWSARGPMVGVGPGHRDVREHRFSQGGVGAGSIRVAVSDRRRERRDQSGEVRLDAERQPCGAPADSLYLPGPVVPSGLDVHFVHDSLARDRRVRPVLELLGIAAYGGDAELRSLLAQAPVDWATVWSLAHSLPQDRALRVLQGSSIELRVCTRRGTFVSLSRVSLPGPVVSTDGYDIDAAVVVDDTFHGDLELLRRLGAVSEPVESVPYSSSAAWLVPYREAATTHSFTHLNVFRTFVQIWTGWSSNSEERRFPSTHSPCSACAPEPGSLPSFCPCFCGNLPGGCSTDPGRKVPCV